MAIARREFLLRSAAAVAAAAVPGPLLAHFGGVRPEPVPPLDDPRVKALAARALEAARGAGAAYATVWLTHTWERFVQTTRVTNQQALAVGVRALVDGYWGFASSAVWSPDEMARLGREACHQAKVTALGGKPRALELAPVPTIHDGRWVMPVKFDPFEVSPFEVIDCLESLELFAMQIPGVRPLSNSCYFRKQEKAFASTAGSYCTQRLYRTAGNFAVTVAEGGKSGSIVLSELSPAGLGWELYRDQPLRERIRQAIDECKAELRLPVKPVEVGRYDTVFDAYSVANLLHETLRPATELDRALGDEANAGGTSYLTNPLGMVGTHQVGAPQLTVTADRGEPGGCATVRWDDEGVEPDEFALVDKGVLVDFQTTREYAGWLKDYYAKRGRPFRSHGCAAAPSAVDAPMLHAPNLFLSPGREVRDFDALIAEVGRGVAVRGVDLHMDFQHADGLAVGRIYEVKEGKRVAMLNGAGILFRAPQLWKALRGVGGKDSMRRFGMTSRKGEPAQEHVASVTAPPACFEQLTLIDALRTA